MLKKAIILDLEGVILNIDYQKTFQKFSEYGIKVTYNDTFKSLTEEYDAGKITTDEMYEKFCKNYCDGHSLEKQQFVDAWNAMLLYAPDVNIEYLFNLKREGYRIVLLSNINELHAANVKETYGEIFKRLFDKVFYSYEMRALKPEAESFKPSIKYLMEEKVNKQK